MKLELETAIKNHPTPWDIGFTIEGTVEVFDNRSNHIFSIMGSDYHVNQALAELIVASVNAVVSLKNL